MNSWGIDTNEEFLGGGFNVFLDNTEKHNINEWNVYLLANYPREHKLIELGVNLVGIENVYEIIVVEDNSGMMSLTTAKDSNKVTSVSSRPVNGLIVVSLLQSDESIIIQSYSNTKGKVEKDIEIPGVPL